MDLTLGHPVLTPESQPVAAVGSNHGWRLRSIAWVAAIAVPVTILAVVMVPARARPDPDLLWDQAQAALRSGKPADALAKLVRIRRLRAPTTFDWMLTAQISLANGHTDDALAALGRIPESDPLASQALLLTGRIERQRNRIRAAEAAFKKAVARDPGLIEPHKELIYIYGVQLRRRELDAEFKALGRLTNLTHHDLFTWSITHFTGWRPDIAQDLERFIQADPDDRFSRLALGFLLFDEPEMESKVERILEPLPRSDPDATALRIELKLTHGHIGDAITMLAGAPCRHPHLARLRGRVALMQGDHAAAVQHFEDALSKEPYERVSLAELGKALVLGGDSATAQAYLTRARRLDEVYNLINRVNKPNQENQVPDLTRIGRACEAAGLSAEARGWYLLAINRQPLDSEAQQALHRLRDVTPP